MDAVVQLDHVSKTYGTGTAAAPALSDVSATIGVRELVAVIGASGSGKSTLLNLMAGLDAPTGGRVRLLGRDVSLLSDRALSRLRLHEIGFVFQSFNLFPALTVHENVAWPLELAGARRARIRDAVAHVLGWVRMAEHARRRPSELSGGEQQRVAIARALVNAPRVLLADEPTGNLDSRSGERVLELFTELHRSRGMTIVMVTHRTDVSRWATRAIELSDGRLIRDAACRPDEALGVA